MGWNAWIRQIHRWLSIIFTLIPLALLFISGVYLFVPPYVMRARRS